VEGEGEGGDVGDYGFDAVSAAFDFSVEEGHFVAVGGVEDGGCAGYVYYGWHRGVVVVVVDTLLFVVE